MGNRQGCHKKRKLPNEHRCKNPSQNISKLNSIIPLKDRAPWWRPWWSAVHPRDRRMVQHLKISHCDTTINKIKDKNNMSISIDAEKHLAKASIHLL